MRANKQNQVPSNETHILTNHTKIIIAICPRPDNIKWQVSLGLNTTKFGPIISIQVLLNESVKQSLQTKLVIREACDPCLKKIQKTTFWKSHLQASDQSNNFLKSQHLDGTLYFPEKLRHDNCTWHHMSATGPLRFCFCAAVWTFKMILPQYYRVTQAH